MYSINEFESLLLIHVPIFLESCNKAIIENSMLLTHLFILFSLIKKHSMLEKKYVITYKMYT